MPIGLIYSPDGLYTFGLLDERNYGAGTRLARGPPTDNY